METKLVNGVRRQMTAKEIEDRQNDILNRAKKVPQIVTQMQGRIAMSRTGILIAVNNSMMALPFDNEDRITWETATYFRRDYPMIETIRLDMGLTVDQVDDLFIAADTVA